MNLGQMMLASLSLVLLGIIALGANTTMLETSEIRSDSEFSTTAVGLATSVVEEAMAKVYDEAAADSTLGFVADPKVFALSTSLGPDAGESYRASKAGSKDFNDFDDFDGLRISFRSASDPDTAHTPGTTNVVVPGLRTRYLLTATVDYVNENNLDVAIGARAWIKKITVTVTSPNMERPVTLPAIMCYWN